jgi:hypothetical protein
MYDYFDYLLNKKFTYGIKYGSERIRSEMIFVLNIERNSSITRKCNCRLLNKNYIQRINPAIDDGKLNSLKLHFQYEQAYNEHEMEKAFGDKTDKIEFQIEHSSPKFLNSDFDFTLVKFIFDYRLKTFFKRRPDYNYLRTRIETSTCTGSLPLQRYSIIDGSIFSYSPFGIFKTLVNKPLEGEKKFVVFWEYNFKSIPFEILGLRYFTRNKYEFILHGAFGRTWLDKDREYFNTYQYTPSYKDEFHHEMGLSIILKYKFLSVRLDGTYNLLNMNNYVGFSLNLIGMSF